MIPLRIFGLLLLALLACGRAGLLAGEPVLYHGASSVEIRSPSGRVVQRTLINEDVLIVPAVTCTNLSGAVLRPPLAILQLNLVSGLEVQAQSIGWDPDGVIKTWSWDFGDGTTESGSDFPFSEFIDHVYPAPGSYRLGLTVRDNDGLTSSTNQVVTVPPPSLAFRGSDIVVSDPQPGWVMWTSTNLTDWVICPDMRVRTNRAQFYKMNRP